MNQNFYEFQTPYKVLALTICSKLHYLGLKAYITKLSKHNTIYIQLGSTDDPYFQIRVSDHQGSTVLRYTLRTDIGNSEKRQYNDGKERFIFTIKNMSTFYLKLAKDIPYLKANCQPGIVNEQQIV